MSIVLFCVLFVSIVLFCVLFVSIMFCVLFVRCNTFPVSLVMKWCDAESLGHGVKSDVDGYLSYAAANIKISHMFLPPLIPKFKIQA